MDIALSGQKISSGNGTIADLFYKKYLDRYPDIRRFFEKTDMVHQAVMLRMALTMIEQYYQHHYEAMEDYMRVLGFRHMRLGISRELYADWRDCMLETLEEFHGSDWHDALEQQWTDAINQSIERILEGYALEEGNI